MTRETGSAVAIYITMTERLDYNYASFLLLPHDATTLHNVATAVHRRRGQYMRLVIESSKNETITTITIPRRAIMRSRPASQVTALPLPPLLSPQNTPPIVRSGSPGQCTVRAFTSRSITSIAVASLGL